MAAASFTLIDLPWLPRQAADFRARLQAIERNVEGDWAQPLRALATQALGLNQAMSMSRALHSLRKERPSSALPRFRLGLASNATVDFVKPLLEVSALRHGLFLDICAADFGQGMQESLDAGSKINRF